MKLRLAEIRARMNLTQEAAAERAGLGRVTVARHEGETRGWSNETLAAYAGGLGVEEWELLGYDLPPTMDLPAETRALVQAAAKLRGANARTALALIDHLLGESQHGSG